MDIEEQTQGAVLVIRPTGPVAGADAEQFGQRLLEALKETRGRYVLDASAVPFVDSKALEALVRVNEAMYATGQAMKVCGLNDTLRQVLRVTGLARLFEQFEGVSAAVRSFR
jgi:anti-anti-sigma factor